MSDQISKKELKEVLDISLKLSMVTETIVEQNDISKFLRDGGVDTKGLNDLIVYAKDKIQCMRNKIE